MKMFILRGKAGSYALPGEKAKDWPKGALDEDSARDFARLRGYDPKVIDVVGFSAANSLQMRTTLTEIRADDEVFALYGFSAGGYSIFHIIRALTSKERDRLALVVVLGAPPAPDKSSYRGAWELIFRLDPPAGHMAGPKALLSKPFGPD